MRQLYGRCSTVQLTAGEFEVTVLPPLDTDEAIDMSMSRGAPTPSSNTSVRVSVAPPRVALPPPSPGLLDALAAALRRRLRSPRVWRFGVCEGFGSRSGLRESDCVCVGSRPRGLDVDASRSELRELDVDDLERGLRGFDVNVSRSAVRELDVDGLGRELRELHGASGGLRELECQGSRLRVVELDEPRVEAQNLLWEAVAK